MTLVAIVVTIPVVMAVPGPAVTVVVALMWFLAIRSFATIAGCPLAKLDQQCVLCG